jgi:hypothetical protein
VPLLLGGSTTRDLIRPINLRIRRMEEQGNYISEHQGEIKQDNKKEERREGTA